jgi:hypothetical protein
MHLSNDTKVTKRDKLEENDDMRKKVNYYKNNVDATTNKNNTNRTGEQQR